MRILQICNVYPPYAHGGIGSSVVDLAPFFAAGAAEFRVAGQYSSAFLKTHGLKSFDASAGYAVHRFHQPFPARPYRLSQWLRRRLFFRQLGHLRKQFPWDLVLCDDYEGPLPFGVPGAAPVVVRLNGSNRVYDDILGRSGDPVMHQFETATLKRAAAWLGVSEFFLEATRCRIAPPAAAVLAVAHNGVDCQRFAAPPVAERVPGRIVFHNSLRPRKGIYDLMDAMPSVLAACPEAELHMFGSCQDFEQVKADLIRRLPQACRPKVHIYGRIPRDDLPCKLHQAQVACYPSHLETFGVAPVEAMAAGCVTIYTDTGPGPEIIQHGVSGLLCQPADPRSLADTLIAALRMSAAERSAMGAEAVARARSRFDREVVVSTYMDLFQRLTNS